MLKDSYSELEYQFIHLDNSVLPYGLKCPRKCKTLTGTAGTLMQGKLEG